jgi:glycosyltransferase involved in cell wall biosynthesis
MQDSLNTYERLQLRGICVIIPTFNNAGTIADVVRRSLLQCHDIIVVNDGSTDNTEDILHGIAGITILTLPKNGGKGHALKQGFKKARSMGFRYAITLDADGQHYPEDIPTLLHANIQHPHSIIVGERKDLDSQERSAGSKFANAFSNFWFCIQTGCRLRDTQTGYRLYPLKHTFILTSRYEAELELLVFSAWWGVPVISVPVRVYYPPEGERVSHFRPFWDFFRISVLNSVLTFGALFYYLPVRLCRRLTMKR